MDKVKSHPLYLGIFATDPKSATKTVRTVCKEAVLQTLITIKPESYCDEQQKLAAQYKYYPIQTQPNEHEVALIQKDYTNFQNFNSPKDNYHITCLFMGKNKDKLPKNDKLIMQNWKDGIKEPINVDFIVYVPNYLMAGYISSTGKVQVSNNFPHMTLLMKEKASAVESNSILTTLNQKLPEVFQKRHKKVTIIEAPYLNISRIILVIDLKFELQAITGDNCSCGKK